MNSALADTEMQLFVDTCRRTRHEWRWVGSWAVSQRFRYMGGANFNLIVEVGDCAGDLENSMISACGQAESFGSGLEKRSRFGVHGCVGIEPAAH